MEAYAVIQTGGKQYRVQANDVVQVETIEGEPGKKIEIAPVLAVSDGTSLTVGTPHVAGAVVTASLVRQLRAPKVVSLRRKRRKGYRRKIGHRQALTEIKVETLPAAR